MKKMKKYNKILLLVIMLLAPLMIITKVEAATFTLGTTSSTQDPNSRIINDKKTLTISGVEGNDILTAYKIIDIYYNSTANTITYEFTANFKAYLATSTTYRNLTIDGYNQLTSGSITNGSITTTSTLDKLVSGYVSYIKTNNVTGTDLTQSGTNRVASLNAGSYLVLPKSTAKIYVVMVGNLTVSEADNDWQLNDQTIVAKVSNPGVITKTVLGDKEINSFAIGTEFTYEITGTIPQYPSNATNKKYLITDTMSNGLTFSGIAGVTFLDGTTKLTVNSNGSITNSANNTVGTITVNGQVITIDLNIDNITSNEITITYKAKLNDNAVIGNGGNSNDAKLTYSNDPYTESTYESDTTSAKVYTYGIDILKYSGTNKASVLKDAVFDIYSDASLTTKVGTITTLTNGRGTYKGLGAGTYYLKEVKAPSGHTLLTNPISIKVATDNANELASNPGYYYIEISNTRNSVLPFTGGAGTYIFSIVGILIVVITTVIYIIYRKNKKNSENREN